MCSNHERAENFHSMIDSSLEMLKSNKNYLKGILDENVYKLFGALILDSKIDQKMYNSFCSLLPYIFIEDDKHH
jgi:hypothetical protein